MYMKDCCVYWLVYSYIYWLSHMYFIVHVQYMYTCTVYEYNEIPELP